MSKYNFMIRKIHSLLGIIPVGIFLMFHLLLNSTALVGIDVYEKVIGGMKSAGLYVTFLELVVIAIPILFHGIYGLYIVYVAKNNSFQYTYYRNWAFYLQRITALITFIFLIWHVWALRLMQEEPKAIIEVLVTTLQNPMLFVLYLIGVISAIYHFANGIATFCMSWGITVGPKSQEVFTLLSLAVFAAVSVLAVAILFGLQGGAI